MINRTHKIFLLFFSLVFTLLITACTDGDRGFVPIAETPEEEKPADIFITGGGVKGPLINAEVNIFKLELDKGEIRDFNAALKKWLELLEQNEVSILDNKATAGSISVATIIDNLQETISQYGFTTELKKLKKNIAAATNFADANTLVSNYLDSEETNARVLNQVKSLKERAATLTDYKTGVKAIKSLTDELEETESFSAARALLADYRAHEKAVPENQRKIDGFAAAIASLDAYRAKANNFGLSDIRHAFEKDIYDVFLQRFDIQNNLLSRQNLIDLNASLAEAISAKSAKETLEKGFEKETNLDLKASLAVLIAKITSLDDFKFDILGRESLYHNYYIDEDTFLQPENISSPTDSELLEEINKLNSLFSANLEPALRAAFILEDEDEDGVKDNLLSFGVTNEQGLLPGLKLGQYRGFVYMEVKSLAKTVDLSSGKTPIFTKFESIFHTDTILGGSETGGEDRTLYFILNGQVQRDSDGNLITNRQEVAVGSGELLEIRPTFLATPLTNLGLGVAIEKLKSLVPFLNDANLDNVPDRYLSRSLLKTSLKSASDLLITSLGIGLTHDQNVFHDASIRLPEMKYFADEELAAIQHRLSIENFSAFVQALRTRTNLSGLEILDLLREDLSDNQLDGNVFSNVIQGFSSIPEYKFLLLSDPSEKFLPDTNVPVSDIFYVMNDELVTTQPEHELSEFPSKRSEMVIEAVKGGLDTDSDGVLDNEDQFPADQNKSRDLSPGYAGIWSIGFDSSEYAYIPFKNDFIFSLNKELIQGSCSNLPCMGLGNLSTSISAEYSLIQAPENHDFTYQAFDSNSSIGFTAFATTPGNYLVKASFTSPDAGREPPIQAYEIIIPIQVIDPKKIELRFNPEKPEPGKKVEVEFKATKGLCALYSFCDELNINLDDNLPDFVNIAYLADIYSVKQFIIRDSQQLGLTSVDSIENNSESSNLSNLRLNDKLSVSVSFSAGSREFIAKSTDSETGGASDSDSDGIVDTEDFFPNDANCALEKDGIQDTNFDGELNNLDLPTCFASIISDATIELDVPFLNETWHYKPNPDDKPSWHYIVREKKYESGFNGLIKLPTLSGTKHSIPSDKHFLVDDVAKRVYFAYKNAAIDYFSLESETINSFLPGKDFNTINSLHLIGTYLLVEYAVDASSFEGILYNVNGNIAQIKGTGNFPKPLAPITLEIDGLNFLSATQNRLEIDWQLERENPDQIIPAQLSNDRVTLLSGQTLHGDVIKLSFTFNTNDNREINIQQTLFVLNLDDIQFTEDTFLEDQSLSINLLNLDASLIPGNDQRLLVNWYKNDESERNFRFLIRDISYPFILEASNFQYGDMIKADIMLKHGDKELLVKQLNAVILGNLNEILPVVDASKTEIDNANLNVHFELTKPSTNDDFFTPESFLPVWRINGAIVIGENGLTFPQLDTTTFSYGDQISVNYAININGQVLQTDATFVAELGLVSTSSEFELQPKIAELGQDISLLTSSFTDEALAELEPKWRINSVVDKDETSFTYPSNKLKYGDSVELLIVFKGGQVDNAFSHIAKASVGLNLFSLQNQVLDPEHDLDSDQDGIPNHQDYFRYDANCSVKSAGHPDDLDDDGIADLDELMGLPETNPNISDTDGDGLSDWDEMNVSLTNPQEPDTDGDGYKDGVEIDIGTDPLDALSPSPMVVDNDFDGLPNELFDGLPNEDELDAGTRVNVFDTDGDGLSDGYELKVSLTPPLNADSDGDGLSDGLEIRITKTNPLNADTDGDGLSDGLEIALGLNPLLVDSNNNGVNDNDEPGFDFAQLLPGILYIADLPNYLVVQDHRKNIAAGTCFNTFIADHKPLLTTYSHVLQASNLSEQQVAFSSSDWAQVVRFDAKSKQFLPSIDLSAYNSVGLTALEYAYKYENGNNDSDLTILYLGFSDGTIRVFDAQTEQIIDLFVAEEGLAVTTLLDQGAFLLAEQVTENGQIVHTAFNKTTENSSKWNADYSYAQSAWLDSKREQLILIDAEHDSNLFILEQFDSTLANPLINVTEINATSALNGPVLIETIEGNDVVRFGSGQAYNLSANAWLSQQLAPFSYAISHQSHRVLALKNSSLLEMTTSSTLNGENFWRFTTQLDQPELISVIPVGFHLLAITAKQPELNVPSEIAFQSIILGDEDGNDLPDWWQRLSSALTLADFNNYQLSSDVSIPDFLNGDPDLDNTVPEPVLVDSDGDGICDHWEVNLFGTDPSSADTDGDNARDEQELGIIPQNPLDCNVMPVWSTISDPLNPDTDGDGLRDGDELYIHGTKPLLADSDSDGLTDFQEIFITETNPLSEDGDADGIADSDGDGLSDNEELNQYDTNYENSDSDGDGLRDDEEVRDYGSNPNLWDSDGDLIPDGIEVNFLTTNPSRADSDGDGLSDSDEVWVFAFEVDEDELLTENLFEVGGIELNNKQNDTDWPQPAAFEDNSNDINSDQDQKVHDLFDIEDDTKIIARLFVQQFTDPNKRDTDGDGLSDFEESEFVFEYPSTMEDVLNEPNITLNPNKQDTDGDGICDIWEVTIFNTNPAEKDTDFDDLTDPVELGIIVDLNTEVDCTNPPQSNPISNVLIRDTDEDGVLDGDEVLKLFTDPRDTDSNDSGISDGSNDFDGDGLTNAQELYLTQTEPFNPDSNGNGLIDSLDDEDLDGLSNIYEINVSKTDPLLFDTNGNGLSDKEELDRGLDPVLEDTDSDGISDIDEINRKYPDYDGRSTDPLNPDTDGDGINDGEELTLAFGTEPLDPDTDNDFLKDGDDIEGLLRPLNHDSDGDGIPDGIEVHYLNTDPEDLDSDNDDIPDADEVWVFAFEVEPAADPLAPPVLTNTLLKVGVLNNKVELNSKRNHPLWPAPQPFAANGKDRLVFDLFDMSDATKIIGRLFIQRFSDPTKSDSDGDGLSDKTEFAIETDFGNGFDLTLESGTFSPGQSNVVNFNVSNPWVVDTDDNGIPDGNEDVDGDLLINLLDQNNQDTDVPNATNPDTNDDGIAISPDTDGDGILDGIEVLILGTNPNRVDTDGDGIADNDEVELDQNNIREIAINEACVDTETRLSDIVGKDYCISVRFNSYPTLTDSDNDGTPDRVTNADSSVTLDHFPLDAACHKQTDGFENPIIGREQCFASWMSDFESLDMIKSVEWLSGANQEQVDVIFYTQGWDKIVRYNILTETFNTPVSVDTDETVIAIDTVGLTKSLLIFYANGKVDRFDLEAATTQTIGTFAHASLSPSTLLAIDSGEFILQFVDANNQSTLYLYDQNGSLLDSISGLQVDIDGALVKCASDNCDSTGEIYSFVVDSSEVKTNLARIELDLQTKTFGSLTSSNALAQITELKGPIRLSQSGDKIYLGSGQILTLDLDLPDNDQAQNLSIMHFAKTYSEFYDFAESSGHFVGVIDYDLSGIPGAPSEPATQNGFIAKDLFSPNQYLLPPISLEERILSLLPYEVASVPEIAIVSRLKDRVLIEKFGASDQDNDGMPGIYEKFYGLDDENLNDKFEDPDNDGFVNIEEYMLGTDPWSGKFEDPDNDGLVNIEEHNYGTDPMRKDTDGDGRDDLDEILNDKDPLDPLDF